MKQPRDVAPSSSDCPSLIDLLRHRALHQPERRVFTSLDENGEAISHLSFGELDRQARSVAAELQRRGLDGQRVLLLFPPGLAFLSAFFGCLYARVVAIPAPTPRLSRLARTLPQLRAIVKDARPAAILAPRDEAVLAAELGPELPHSSWISLEACLATAGDAWQRPAVGRESIAYLQYTSGSTSLPKGAQITHGNVLHNSRDIQQGKRYTSDSMSLCWVPHYHDDGLVQGIIQPIYTGYHALLMSPLAFTARPARWLQAIARYRVTHSGGANFAYEICVRKVTDAERDALDLRSWVMAYNAAEPVRPETLRRFHQRFHPCGFRWTSFAPSYGMAEATLTVSTHRSGEAPHLLACDITALERDKRILERAEGDAGTRVFVGCGSPVGQTVIAIVNPETGYRARPDGVGEIWVQSPAVAAGYAGLPEETEKTFHARLADTGEGPFLRTGDLGFFAGGELFITGRLKDIITTRGENRYPQDIEATVEAAHAALRPGGSAAFSIDEEGEERVVIVAEVTHGSEQAPASASARHESLTKVIQQAVAAAHGLEVHIIALLQPGTLPKTSSGKVRRRAARAEFLGGAMDEIGRWSRGLGGATTGATGARSFRPHEMEAFLVAQVAQRTGAEPGHIDLDAPFIRFGLDSMSGLALVTALGNWLGQSLPDALLSDQLSIRDTIGVITGGRDETRDRAQPAGRAAAAPGASNSMLIELRPIAARQPFFCVGGLTGLVKNLWPLACFLGDDRSFFALHTPGLDGSEKPPRRVEQIAARLIPDLRAVQPIGPYLLGGHSFGGFVAYEMARQLRDEGHVIAGVVLFDTTMPEPSQAYVEVSRETVIHELVNLFQHLLEQKDAAPPSHEALARMSRGEQLALLHEILEKVKIQLESEQVENLVQMFAASLEATHRYAAPQSSFPVTLFRAMTHVPHLVENSHVPIRLEVTRGLGWERVCDELEIRDVPGDHLSLLQHPHVRGLALALKDVLRACSASVKLHAAPTLSESFPYRQEAP